MTFTIGGRVVAADQPPFVIAEVGVNHDGRLDQALRLVDAAADAGADAVKFQTFRAASLATADAELAAYQRSGADADSQRAMLERLELPPEAWSALAHRAGERGIAFLSTPFDPESVALLAGLGVPAMKVGSGDLTNAILLRAVGGTRLPTILSTGMGTLEEVAAAVRVLRDAGTAEIAVLHCASIYPAPIDDLNLRAMETLAVELGLPVGFSDHSDGLVAPVAAVARGALIVEKHITLDRSLPGPDHAASLDPPAFERMVGEIRSAWEALGDGSKQPRPAEAEIMRVARRSLVASRDLDEGHVLSIDDLDARRPGTGLSPMRVDELVGRRLTHSLRTEQLLLPDDVDPPLDP
jgi:N-acetylneuraminate synthase/N,N'-diacetyllegionaminate synthase